MTIFKGFKPSPSSPPSPPSASSKLTTQKPTAKTPPEVSDIDARTRAEQKAEAAARKIYSQTDSNPQETAPQETAPQETGGPKGLEPTRYGDWEKAGRCIDF